MDEANSRKLGSSLKVPVVQELAKQQLAAVPLRYIRDDIEKPVLFSSIFPQVPVIDMEKLLASNGDDNDSELERLHFACKEWGFSRNKYTIHFQFYTISSVGESWSEFIITGEGEVRNGSIFELPMKEKKKFEEKGDLEGYGQTFVVSEEQKLDWADIYALYEHTPY
ncbi:putative protein SRG1-like [Capsicum annuum]|nr:putative protein SRG1-like [Capsicum annuum]